MGFVFQSYNLLNTLTAMPGPLPYRLGKPSAGLQRLQHLFFE